MCLDRKENLVNNLHNQDLSSKKHFLLEHFGADRFLCSYFGEMFPEVSVKSSITQPTFSAPRWQRSPSGERAAQCFNSHLNKHQSVSQLLGSLPTHSGNPSDSATSLKLSPRRVYAPHIHVCWQSLALRRWRSFVDSTRGFNSN